ncbi:hypothetical protein BpHYR1_005775 [Brachionus plicatilis]|uniref:Uncharacterized protein n=1 Tax=Brachionus plicatilis TaxID=10195 RepID=A0A3M7QCD4_BRAPC|nr:hypothetical protein BpHYR1_005775 [Brachionus plicatilis]
MQNFSKLKFRTQIEKYANRKNTNSKANLKNLEDNQISVWRRASLAGGQKFGPRSWPAKSKTNGHFGGQTKSAIKNFRKRKIFKYYIQISKL